MASHLKGGPEFVTPAGPDRLDLPELYDTRISTPSREPELSAEPVNAADPPSNEIERLHAQFEKTYRDFDRKALKAARRRAYSSISIEDVNASHMRKIEAQDYEVLGDVSVGHDGSRTYPVSRYRDKNEPFMLVQYHQHPSKELMIRTFIELDDVGSTVDALIEFNWLTEKIDR